MISNWALLSQVAIVLPDSETPFARGKATVKEGDAVYHHFHWLGKALTVQRWCLHVTEIVLQFKATRENLSCSTVFLLDL